MGACIGKEGVMQAGAKVLRRRHNGRRNHDPIGRCHDLVAVRRCAEGQLAFGAARGDIMAHVINSFLLFFCWPAFVIGMVFAAASLLI